VMMDINKECFVKNVIMKAIWQKNVNFCIHFVTFVEDKPCMKPMIAHWRSWEGNMLKKIYCGITCDRQTNWFGYNQNGYNQNIIDYNLRQGGDMKCFYCQKEGHQRNDYPLCKQHFKNENKNFQPKVKVNVVI
jgi:hypothetical protein